MNLKIPHIISVLFLIFIIPNAFAQSISLDNQVEGTQGMFGSNPEQTVLIEISAGGHVHITHDVQRDNAVRYVEFVKGTVSNLEVHDKNGEDVEFSKTGYGDTHGVQIFMLSPVEVEYDLDEALEFVDGIWHWEYQYVYGNAKFFLPDEAAFVYVNDRYVDLGDAKGLNCHGCGLDLAYHLGDNAVIEKIQWESKNFPVEIISQNKLINFNFIQPDKIISFETENSQLITLKIPLELLWNPYQVYFFDNNEKSSLISPQNVVECNETQAKITIQGTATCYGKIFNNEIEIDEDNILLTIHPKNAGTIIIQGTSAIPEFPLFMPLVIGVLMVILLQFRNKINFNF